MKVRLSRIHFPVTALGPGRRIGIWFQGCRNACPGCISRDTWSCDGGHLIEVIELFENCYRMTNGRIDGITITGGEPFEQPDGLNALLDVFEEWRMKEEFDILCYSGLSLNRLQNEYMPLLERIDVIIPEPFIQGCPSRGIWRGSDNQPLIALSSRGKKRYAVIPDGPPPIQVCISDGAIWFIGIPRPGDMDRVLALAKERGLVMENLSWRT